MSATVEDQVRDIVAKVMDRKPDEIKSATRFAEDLNCDDLDLLDITMATEEAFPGLSIGDSEWEWVKKVADLVLLVQRRLQ